MSLTVQNWQQSLATEAAERVSRANVEGVDGADSMAPTTAAWSDVASREIRRMAYGLLSPSPWQASPFNSGWNNNGGFSPCGSMRDALGRIHLRGMVNRLVGIGTTIFHLPAEHCPAMRKVFAVYTNTGAGSITIETDGTVTHSTGGVLSVSLESISFDLG